MKSLRLITLLFFAAQLALAETIQVPPGPVTFSWDANPASDNVDGYSLGENGHALGQTDATTTTYTVEGLAVGTHTIELRAFRGEAMSDPASITFEIVRPKPGTPQNFRITAPRLANISTRAQIATGEDVMIGGFVIRGQTPKRLIARAIGPSLTAYGIRAAVGETEMELRDASGSLVSQNSGWKSAPNRQEIIDSTLAPTDDRESAVLITLAPGAYTVIVRGKSGTAGVGMVEVFDLDGA